MTEFDIGPNLVSVIIALIAAASSITAAYFAYKSKSTAAATHELVNGRMTELLALTKSSATAAGVSQGVAASQPQNGIEKV